MQEKMELENKAKATLQELLDVVRSYREAAERAEHEASRVRVECEAWRSRATEEGRRNARLRRILAAATQVTSKPCMPSLRRSARRGLKNEDMSHQFGSVLALALAFSGPGTQATADQGILQHGTGDAGRSSASLSAAAAAATCAVTFTALAASPKFSLQDTISLQTSSTSLGLVTKSQGFQEQPGARAGRSPGRQAASGGSDRGNVGSGPQLTCAGADSDTRNTSCSSLSSMGAGAGPGSSSTRGHSRAGFKLVLRGGNGDSASLRQLSTYNAMFPPTVGKSAGSRGGGGVGGAVKVHESYSACELSSAGTASGSMAAPSSLAGTGSASTSGDITTVAAGGGGRVGIGGRTFGTARVSERERAARAHSASCAVLEAQLALPVVPLLVAGAGPAMEGGPGGSSPDLTNSTSSTPTSRGTVTTATSLSSEAREIGAASGMTQGPHGLRQQHQVKTQPGEGVVAAPGTGDLARVSGSSDDEQMAAELGIATATSEPWPGCASGLRVAAAPLSAASAPAPAAAPSRNSSSGGTPAFAAQPRAATAGPACLHRDTAGAQAALLAAHLSPELGLGRAASAGSSLAPAAASGPSPLQSTAFERSSGPSGVTQLPLCSMHNHHEQQHHLCAPRGALDTLPEVIPSASLQHIEPQPSAPAVAAAGLGPGPVGRTQSVVYSRSQLPAALQTAAIPRRETVPAGSGASFQEELSWHAGILHKQRTKLQDDLASITQSSNLIRCNRATCNLAPGSPQQPLALGSPTRTGSPGSLALMQAPPHSAAPAATLSPFGAAAAAELAAAREATAEAATTGAAGGDGAFSAAVAAVWPEAQLPPRFGSGPATMTPPVAAAGSTAIRGANADTDASRLHIPIPVTSAAEAAAAPLQRQPSLAPPSEPSCATCQAMSPEPAFVALYWVTPPAAALVVTKPSPGVRPTFERVLSLLHQRGVATYVEPSMVRSWPGLSCSRPPPRFRSDGGDGVGYGGSEGGEESVEEVDEGKDGPQMPGCYTGVPMLLSWPADDGDDCHSQMVPPDVAAAVDFVVVLGGDGTVLWTCHIFGNQSVPPLIPFNLGSLGFLTPFDPAHAEEVLGHVMEGGFPIMLRHRLHCHIIRASDACAMGLKACAVRARGPGAVVNDGAPPSDGCDPAGGTYASAVGHGGDCSPAGREWVVLNEVVIDRGISSFLGSLECYCDGAFVTHVQGDGLIVATPTGSTAYNLAAGGSMVHPQVPGILFTPICPHSLSFRPLIFPDHVSLCVQVPANSRSQMWCSFDGKDRQALNAGDAVVIRMSAWPVPTVCSKDASRDWFSGVREGLHWNMRRLQAGAGQ